MTEVAHHPSKLFSHICEARRLCRILIILTTGLILLAVGLFLQLFAFTPNRSTSEKVQQSQPTKENVKDPWVPQKISEVSDSVLRNKLNYGKDLIANTSLYLGPNGTVAQLTNGMNCQNCHLQVGTKPFGNNYGSVYSTYPKYRARSGKVEDCVKRINDCMERSLNGKALDSTSEELLAMKAYIEFIGSNVLKGEKAVGSGIVDLPLLNRPADTVLGQQAYAKHCASCHLPSGQGVQDSLKIGYSYPPLWGSHSFNSGAGIYRLSRLAGFIKYNMPFGVSYPNAILTDEEAWDIAAYVNSQVRPVKDLQFDWPKIEEKPMDHPFGPFADPYSALMHKYGPFQSIVAWKESHKKKNDALKK